MRLIYANDVKKRGDCYPPIIRKAVANILSHTRTVKDAERVKHGRWKDVEPTLFRDRFATCSVCGVRQLIDKDNFCSNCGAKMDEVEE